LIRYWLTASDDPAFDAKVADICTLYKEAPERAARGERVMSTDELTGVQAREPTHPDLPTAPGLVRRRAYEYIRHGTPSFMLNRDVVSGQVVSPSAGPTRTEEDVAAHITRTLDTDPDAPAWHFVVDNLTRTSPRRWSAWSPTAAGSRLTLASKASAASSGACAAAPPS